MASLHEQYRPRTWADVAGQPEAVKEIRRTLERCWGGRAWLITGASANPGTDCRVAEGIAMALWHCWDRLSGERWEENCGEDDLSAAVKQYIAAGIDQDTGDVDYDVLATAVDGSEHVLSGRANPGTDC